MNTWFTSDLHFFHANVVKFCNRPWSVEDQTEEIIARWNSRVGLLDNVYHLGDFAFAGRSRFSKVVDIIKQLNGHIHFIRGNHCASELWQRIEYANIPHIAWIKDYHEAKIDGQKVVMCHYPFVTWNGSHYGSYSLHGHCHGSLPSEGRRLDVGIDNHPDQQVFSWDEVRAHMAQQDFIIKDHHTEDRP